jgi:hypothetical protein
MEIGMKSGDVLAQENRPLRLYRAHDMKIFCTAGTVWITSAGETTDIFLSAGQNHQARSNRLILIEGIGDAWIRLENKERPVFWRRAWATTRRLWQKMINQKDQVASAPGWSA